MAISYLVTLDQLSVLAHFCQIDSFRGLPELPHVSGTKCNTLIEAMGKQGMVHIHNHTAAVDIVLHFILQTMASPGVFIQGMDVWGYCTQDLGVVLQPDRRSKTKFKITPAETAKDFATILWQDREINVSIGGQTHIADTLPALEQLILAVYKEAV